MASGNFDVTEAPKPEMPINQCPAASAGHDNENINSPVSTNVPTHQPFHDSQVGTVVDGENPIHHTGCGLNRNESDDRSDVIARDNESHENALVGSPAFEKVQPSEWIYQTPNKKTKVRFTSPVDPAQPSPSVSIPVSSGNSSSNQSCEYSSNTSCESKTTVAMMMRVGSSGKYPAQPSLETPDKNVDWRRVVGGCESPGSHGEPNQAFTKKRRVQDLN